MASRTAQFARWILSRESAPSRRATPSNSCIDRLGKVVQCFDHRAEVAREKLHLFHRSRTLLGRRDCSWCLRNNLVDTSAEIADHFMSVTPGYNLSIQFTQLPLALLNAR